MKISFLMPSYDGGPSGGFRVVYEYANHLVARGHEVSIVQPRRLKYLVPQKVSGYQRIRKSIFFAKSLLSNPKVKWHHVDERVRLLFVADSDNSNIPDGNVIFATNWHTVESVLRCSSAKGAKSYLLQGYESYNAAKELVDATWKAPLHKIVISEWLRGLAAELGVEPVTYIPNGIDHAKYRLKVPVENREQIVAMLFSSANVKGGRDGIAALSLVKKNNPNLRVILFGTSRRTSFIPQWMEYHRNPSQEFIIDEIYSKAQVFVSASWLEGFALPPAEAAACGCAIASTDSRGVREFLEHGVTGLLSQPKNAEALASNIASLLDNDELRMRLARAGQKSVGRLQWQKSTDMLEDFLSLITSKHEQNSSLGSVSLNA